MPQRGSQRRADGAAELTLMALALAEGEAGLGTTSPNPSVGAVIVSRGRVIGRGRTQPPGGPHAEVMALREAGARARGADLYCTLEPCNHTGRTGPCTEAIREAGVARVFYGTRDVNPRVRGGGAGRLRRAGITVEGGVAEEACVRLHAAFFKHVTTGIPRVTLKVAATLDGRIAADSGHSKWITGPDARRWVHRLRSQVDAVMVGAGTVRADDPQLASRGVGATHQPLRVVVEGAHPLSLGRRVFDRSSGGPTLLVTPDASAARQRALNRAGVDILECPLRGHRGRVDLARMFRELGRRSIMHVLCEGGAGLASALLRGEHVDRLDLFIAPKLLGSGPTWFAGPRTKTMQEAIGLGFLEYQTFGDDVLLSADLRGQRA